MLRVVEFYSGIGGMHFALKGKGFVLHYYNLTPVVYVYYSQCTTQHCAYLVATLQVNFFP